MIQRCFFLLFLLVPCIVKSSNDVDSAIEDLNNKSEVLQDSVSYLLQQAKEMKRQLEKLSSATSNAPNQTCIAELMESVNLSKEQMNELVKWKIDVEAKLNKFKGSMDTALLDTFLQPVKVEIKKIEKDLATVSQKEEGIQKAVTKQIQQMSFLVNKMNEKEKKEEKKIGDLSSRTQILEIQMNNMRHILKKVGLKVTEIAKKASP